MLGAWVSNYVPLRPGSHPQRGRIVRATYRVPGMLSGDRLTTLEGLGQLGDDTGDDQLGTAEISTDGGATWSDAPTPTPMPAASTTNDTDWTKLVSNIVSAGGKASADAMAIYSAAKQNQGFSQNQISALISAAMGQAQRGGVPASSGSTGLLIGIGVAAVLAFAFMGRSRSNPWFVKSEFDSRLMPRRKGGFKTRTGARRLKSRLDNAFSDERSYYKVVRRGAR